MKPYRATALLLLLVACKGAPASDTLPAGGDTASVMAPSSDSHLFDLADSTEVWMVTGREAHARTGETCIEHGIQLRKGPLKMQVPLLYVSTLPAVVDGKLTAQLSKDCVTGDTYVIDPRTAQPTLMTPTR